MNRLRAGSVRAQSRIATVPMTFTSMMRAGSSASGSRLASAAVPRDIGVTVAPWTTCVMVWRARASRQASGRVTSATTTSSRSATGEKKRRAAASIGAESITTSRDDGWTASQWRPSTLMTNPVPPVTSKLMLVGKLNEQPNQGARCDREVLELHALLRIMAAMVVAHEDHRARNADLGEHRGIVTGAACHFEGLIEYAHQ